MDIKVTLGPQPGVQRIDTFPNAVKLVKIGGEKAKRLGDIALHRSDLLMARSCLDAIDEIGDREDLHVVISALWRQAIVLYIKCFGDDERFQLDARRIYKNRSPEAMLNFEFFKDLRNKNFIHDENAYTQSLVLAGISPREAPHKLEGICGMNLYFDVRGPENKQNLRLLIASAETWVAEQFDRCRDSLKVDLEKLPYEELLNLPAAEFRVPTVDEMKKSRGSRP